MSIQQTRPAGWSKDYKLHLSQKYWLDPGRGGLEGESAFQAARQQGDWKQDIMHHFSTWLQHVLKKRFPKQAHEFADPELNEWWKQIDSMIKECERMGIGAFK